MSFQERVKDFIENSENPEKSEVLAALERFDEDEKSKTFDPPADKSCLVLWSGGLDSTFLIEKRLQEGWQVEAAYVEIENNYDKVERELQAVNTLKEHFSNQEKFTYLGTVYSCLVESSADAGSLHLRQLPIWIAASTYLSSRPIQEICLGYVENREIIDSIHKLWEAWAPLFKKEPPKLTFPLLEGGFSKKKIIQESPDWLIESTVFCEENFDSEETHPCGKCKPCLTRKLVEIELREDGFKRS